MTPPHQHAAGSAFPTFRRWLRRAGIALEQQRPSWRPPWRMSPWWPGETLAAKQRALVRLLAAGVRVGADLVPLVENLAAEHRWLYRRKLCLLAQRLAEGTPLASALEQTPGVLADRAVLAIRFGSQSGTLAASLAELAAEDPAPPAYVAQRLRGVARYAAFLAVALGLVADFLLVKIVPSFQQIFDDFGLQAPGALIGLVVAGRWLFSGVGAILLLGLAALWLVHRGRGGRFLRRRVLGRLVRPVAELRASDLLSHLGVAAEAGRPLVGAVSTLARYHYDPSIRRRLLFVRNEVDHGAELFESLAAVKLITVPVAAAMEAISPWGNRAWTLRQLAQAQRSRTLARLSRAIDVLAPAVVLVAALAVLGVALAIMTSLVHLTGMVA